MKSLANDNQPLSEMDLLPPTLIEKLSEYRIETLGQLLGATRGLSHALEVFESEEELNALKILLEEIPTEVLARFRALPLIRQTGCIPPDNSNEPKDRNNEKDPSK